MIEKISADKYTMTKNDILIDLRESRLFSFGSIEGAVNIPADDIVKLYSLPKDKRIVLLCQSGDFSAEIAQLLDDNGYKVAGLEGGYRKWLINCMNNNGKSDLNE